MQEIGKEQLENGVLTPAAQATRRMLAEVTQDGNKQLLSLSTRESSNAVAKSKPAIPELEIVPSQKYFNPPDRVENPKDGAMAPREKEEEPRRDNAAAPIVQTALSLASPAYGTLNWLFGKKKKK